MLHSPLACCPKLPVLRGASLAPSLIGGRSSCPEQTTWRAKVPGVHAALGQGSRVSCPCACWCCQAGAAGSCITLCTFKPSWMHPLHPSDRAHHAQGLPKQSRPSEPCGRPDQVSSALPRPALHSNILVHLGTSSAGSGGLGCVAQHPGLSLWRLRLAEVWGS